MIPIPTQDAAIALGLFREGQVLSEITRRRRAEQREICPGNFRAFIEAAWPTVEPAKGFIANWHIDAIAEHLQAVTEGKIKRLLVNIPPGHAKSLLVSVLWQAWVWLKNPKWRGMFSSYSGDLALRDAVRGRSLIESPWYQETFRPKWGMSEVQNLKHYYENTEKGSRISISVGGRATGYRASAVICDDSLNARDQNSEPALDEVVFWWDQVMSSRLDDPVNGARVIIAQRLSERDLCGHVLEEGGYEHLCLPSKYEPDRRCVTSIGWSDPRTQDGELLFPQLFPDSAIDAAQRELGNHGFAGQHQQRPAPAGGGMLKAHWWKFWQPKGANMKPVRVKMPDGSIDERQAVDLPGRFDRALQTWDLAFKGTKTSDYVVGQVHAAHGADRFILDQVRDRMDMPATVLAIRKLSARWPEALLKLVEDKANGPAVISSLRHEIAGLVEVKPEGGKVSRAAAASPQLESGNWYLPHPLLAPWVDGFIHECAAFPAGANDDQVDAWSQGAKRLLGVAERTKTVARELPSYGGSRSWMA